MRSNNGIKIGDTVKIHHYVFKEDEKNVVEGVVTNIEMSDDLSHHGSPWYEEVYTVKGNDGNTYQGTYGEDYLHHDKYEEKTYIEK